MQQFLTKNNIHSGYRISGTIIVSNKKPLLLPQFLLIFRKAQAGELVEESGLSKLAKLTEISVEEVGVGGAKNFFEAKVNIVIFTFNFVYFVMNWVGTIMVYYMIINLYKSCACGVESLKKCFKVLYR